MVRRFQNRRRVPDAAADAASGRRDAAEFRARAPDVSGGRRADRRGGRIAVSRPAIHRRARSGRRRAGAGRQRDSDRRAARGWPGRRRRRIRRRPHARIETGDHARQPARHLWRHDSAGELRRKTVGAGGDPGRLCRAEPDRRACAGARHPACDVVEPALCAQGRIGPQCRPARCGDGDHRRRAWRC